MIYLKDLYLAIYLKNKFMLFSNKQVSELFETVDFFHTFYILEHIGLDSLNVKDKYLLKKRGIDLTNYKGKPDYITWSYQFGRIESMVRDRKTLRQLNLKQWKKFADTNTDLKLTKSDKYNIKIAKQQAYNDIKRLADDIKGDLKQSLIEAGKIHKKDIGQKSLAKKVSQTVSKTLANRVKKYSARFKTISGYNMHNAYQEGIAAELLHTVGEFAKVYFTVHPDACDHCVRVYLSSGRGSQPKIFLLKTVINNGSNIGRKAKDYKPSVGPLHPHCRCKMNKLPQGKSEWSEAQNRYVRSFK